MAFVPALNTVRLATNYISATGEQATNVQYFQRQGVAPDVAAIQDLIDAVKAWQTASWAFCASNSWQTDVYEARLMNEADDMQLSDIETINGEVNSPSLPAQNTLAISTRTGLTGRSRRGRVYHVGLAESQVVGSRVSLGPASDIVTYYDNLITDVDSAGWTWVVASFVSNGAPRETALLTPITNCILADTVVDSMDTRKPRAV